jgi:hypothetical protein
METEREKEREREATMRQRMGLDPFFTENEKGVRQIPGALVRVAQG